MVTLDHGVGVKEAVFEWFKSYLTGRLGVFFIYLSSPSLTGGIPQGSIPSPVLISLSMLLLGSIFNKYGT